MYNEAAQLAGSVRRVVEALKSEFRSPKSEGVVCWEVVIAKNGSTDGTWRVAEGLAQEFAGTARMRVVARQRAAR